MVANLERVPESETRGEDDRHPKARKFGIVALLVLGAISVLALVLWSEGAQRRAIRDMPAGERQALYSRTLENLQSVCQAPEEAMRDFCGEQARLALDFAECDEACRRLAGAQLSRLQPPR